MYFVAKAVKIESRCYLKSLLNPLNCILKRFVIFMKRIFAKVRVKQVSRQGSLENTLTQFLILSGNLYSHHLSGVSIQWMDMFAAITCIGRP